MTVQIVPTPSAPPVKGPYSHCVRAGDWRCFAGQIGIDAGGTLVSGGMGAELDQIFINLQAIFADAGVVPADVAKATVFVTDLNAFAPLADGYAAFFGDHRPARTTVQVAALPAGASIEVEVWAHTA